MKYFLLALGTLIITLGLTSFQTNQNALYLDTDTTYTVKSIFIDENNNKWFGTDKGLFFYHNEEWLLSSSNDYLAHDSVNSLTFEKTKYGSEIWVATEKGVSVLAYDYDGVTGATSYTGNEGVLGTKITDVVVDTNSNKIFGSDEGLTIFSSGEMDSVLYEDYTGSLINAAVNDLAIRNDSLYIAYNGGIGRLVLDDVDGVTGASRWTSEYGITPLSGNINCIEFDSIGNQWFGTDSGAEKHIGLKAKEGWELYTEQEGLVNNFVEVIRLDSTNNVWFGTHGGVSFYNNLEWQSYTKADGLASDTVYDIAFEDEIIWFATHKGVSKLENNQITNINIPSGTTTVETFYTPEKVKIYQSNKDLIIKFLDSINNPNSYNICIYNLNGQLVTKSGSKTTENQVKLKLKENISPGIYIITIDGDNKSVSKKVILK